MEWTYACRLPSRSQCVTDLPPGSLRLGWCGRLTIWMALCLLQLCFHSDLSRADEPLHVRIDQLLAEIHPGPESALCSDGTFLRRVHLDLVGRIPSGEEARRFLADENPDKRRRVVEQLLSDPEHARFMARVFDVMLMERRADKHVTRDQWEAFLLTSFQQNKPLNQMVREILSADGVQDDQRGPAKFYLEREAEPNLVTREVGRMFFGMDLQCAQCHDHPSIDDYYQSDYYGLFAFVNRSYLFQPDKKKPAVLAEKAEGDAKFKSVFTEEEGQTRPRLPGSAQIDEPRFAKDEAYQVKPDPKDKNVRPIPKHSRRQALATRATDGSSHTFNRNLSNRIWAHMLGRGLVHPVDQHHSDNPPIAPKLLDLLAGELVNSQFDLRMMLREIALSRAYQRGIDLPTDLSEHAKQARQQKQAWDQSMMQWTEAAKQSQQVVDELEDRLHDGESSLTSLVEAEAKAREAMSAAEKAAAETSKKVVDQRQVLTKQQSAAKLLNDAVESTKKAAGLFTDDAPLAEAAKIIQARHQKLASQVEGESAKLAKLTQTEADLVKRLAEAKTAAADTTSKLQTAESAQSQLATQLAAAKQTLQSNRTLISHAKQQIVRLGIAIQFGETADRLKQLTSRKGQLAASVTAVKRTIAELTDQHKQQSDSLPIMESKYAQTVSASAEASRQLESIQQAAAMIADSTAKVNSAAKILTDDSELKAALGKLEASAGASKQKVQAQQSLAMQRKAAEQEAVAKLRSHRESLNKAEADLASAKDQLKQWQTEQMEMSRELDQITESLPGLRDQLTTAWSDQFSIAVLQPLSPEQLSWSIMEATGYIDRQRTSTAAAIEKKTPLKPEEKADQAKLAARRSEVEKQTRAKLQAVVNRFVKLFGAAGGQPQDDFFATVDQALYFRNGGEVLGWLSPTNGNLTDRLQKMESPRALADELYLSLLTRYPTEAEATDVSEYLTTSETDKRGAVQAMAWALLTSAEFRFQH